MAYKLYTSWFCPFAQRAWIALLEKGIPFEYIETDPYDKKPEFLALNPRGLVPIIVDQDGKSVYESAVCIEYADELKNEDKALLPKEPYQRARVRIWSDFISKKIVPFYYQILQRQDKSEQDAAKETMLQNLITLSKEMDDKGPYFLGNSLGMVDIMLCPFTLRFYVLKHYRNFEVPDTQEYKRFHKWMAAVHGTPSVVKTVADEQKLIESYKRYADNVAKSEMADAIRQGKVLP